MVAHRLPLGKRLEVDLEVLVATLVKDGRGRFHGHGDKNNHGAVRTESSTFVFTTGVDDCLEQQVQAQRRDDPGGRLHRLLPRGVGRLATC